MSSGETIEITLTGPQAAILKSNSPRNLFMSGQGSGKTSVIGFLAYLFNQYVPNSTGLIAANTNKQLTNATLKEMFKVWSKLGFHQYSESNPHGSYVIDRKPPSHFKKMSLYF